MRISALLASLALALALLAGCRTSPYDYADNWLLREDPTRTFSIPSDVIYLQDELYTNLNRVTFMYAHAMEEVGRNKFGGIARVFSPLVVNEEDLELAMKWYFKHHHPSGRPFSFIGAGRGGELLKAYEEANKSSLEDDGLVASFYTASPYPGFVTPEMVREIRTKVIAKRYKSVWKRDMLPGMLDEVQTEEQKRK